MKQLRVYVDTSVIGGCFDPEFAQWSNALLRDFEMGFFRPVLSKAVEAEILSAPEQVREKYADLLALGAEFLPVTNEADELVARYLERGILNVRFRGDMLHIALATVFDVDVLVSWNFKHIVKLQKIQLFNAVNLEQGYKAIQIYSPREVATDEQGT
jgi:hypothetical protein